MGATNCKERVDVGPLIESIFELNYMLFALHTLEFVAHGNSFVNFGAEIATITVDLFLSTAMLQLGGAVQCAIDNNIYGSETKSRFVNLSGEYIDWAFMFTIYFIFGDTIFLNVANWIVGITSFFGLGLFSYWI